MPLFRRKSKAIFPPDRTLLLAAIPLRNELVRAKPRESGLRLTAPMKPNPLRRFFAAADAAPPEKSFDLDDLGVWVWNHLDGKTSVEELIRTFARDHRVNLREAEVSVMAFLKTLTQRNLIALVAPKKS